MELTFTFDLFALKKFMTLLAIIQYSFAHAYIFHKAKGKRQKENFKVLIINNF